MQSKIKLFLGKFSIVTTHPDADWLKIFTLLLMIAVLLLGWNIYFFFSVRHDLAASAEAGQTQAAETSVSEENRIKAVIEQYEARATTNASVIESAPAEVADPAGA